MCERVFPTQVAQPAVVPSEGELEVLAAAGEQYEVQEDYMGADSDTEEEMYLNDTHEDVVLIE